MSAEFLRFWRYIQRFALGGIFSTILTVLLIGQAQTHLLITTVFAAEEGKTAIISILLLLIIIIFGSVGAFLVDVLVAALASVLRLFFSRITFFKRWFQSGGMGIISLLLRPTASVVIDTIRQRISSLMEHLNLITMAEMAVMEKEKEPDQYYLRLQKYFENNNEPELTSMMVYAMNITQEQRTIDNFRWDMSNVYALWVNVAMGELVYLSWQGLSWLRSFYLVLIFIAVVLFTLPYLVSVRKAFVYYWVAAYMQIYKMGESASADDRDTI